MLQLLHGPGPATGDSLVEEEGVEAAAELLPRAESAEASCACPMDLVLGDEFDAGTEVASSTGSTCPTAGWASTSAPRTAAEYPRRSRGAGTVLWNGPMGAFELEPFAAGTRAVAEAVADRRARPWSAAATRSPRWPQFGLADDVDWLSTGGGASLELLEGRACRAWRPADGRCLSRTPLISRPTGR